MLRCRAALVFLFVFVTTGRVRAQVPEQDGKALLGQLIAHEEEASRHHGRYRYVAEERSDRTGGHLWVERVVETPFGHVRLLLTEDGVLLSPDRAAAQRRQLVDIVAHPDVFQKREQAVRNDEIHARQMLQLLPKAFLFDSPVREGAYLRVRFRPNPAYAPQSLEERVLCQMVGSFVVEERAMRLHAIEGRLPQDVSLGFGFLATIKAGSSFTTMRERVDGDDWKTVTLDTDINGKAIFFRAIAKKQHSSYREFKRLPGELSLEQAAALAQQP